MGKTAKKILISGLVLFLAWSSANSQSIYRRGNFYYALNSDSLLTHDYFYFQPEEHKALQFSVAGTVGSTFMKTSTSKGGDYQFDIAPGFGLKKGAWQLEAYTRLTTTPGSSFVTPNWRVGPESYPFSAGNLFIMPGFVVNYQAGKYFVLSAGYDKNFIGEGYHSLYLSDNSSNYPYLKGQVDLGKLEYSILYAYFENKKSYAAPDLFPSNKLAAIHTLTYKPWNWLDVQLFEAVVWQTHDSLQFRGIDVNYLNPVVFYRPIEYNSGSADNELLGWGLNIHPSKNVTLYSQFILDEFLLSKIKERTGWWANKYGMLAGMKCFNLLGVKGLSLLGEISFVRPFTYSHKNPNTNYGHNYQPIAHPWGANFYQLFGCIQYKTNHHRITGQVEIGQKGFGYGYGGNIFPSNDSRFREYGNTQNQGIPYSLGNASVLYAYCLGDSRQTELFIQAGMVQLPGKTVQQASLGIRTPFFNSYSNY